MNQTVQVKGLRELRETLLRKIPLEYQGKVLQAALAAGARLTVAQAKSNAPELTGRLKRAIYATRDSRNSKTTYEQRVVSVRRGKKQQKNNRDAFYWKFVEFGHRIVPRAKGQSTRAARKKAAGQVPARPFMRPAFEATKAKAAQVIADRLKVELDKAAKKAAWNTPR